MGMIWHLFFVNGTKIERPSAIKPPLGVWEKSYEFKNDLVPLHFFILFFFKESLLSVVFFADEIYAIEIKMHVPLQFMSFRKLAISFSTFFVFNFKSNFDSMYPLKKGLFSTFTITVWGKNEWGTSINDVPRFLVIFDLPTLSYSITSHFGGYLL